MFERLGLGPYVGGDQDGPFLYLSRDTKSFFRQCGKNFSFSLCIVPKKRKSDMIDDNKENAVRFWEV